MVGAGRGREPEPACRPWQSARRRRRGAARSRAGADRRPCASPWRARSRRSPDGGSSRADGVGMAGMVQLRKFQRLGNTEGAMSATLVPSAHAGPPHALPDARLRARGRRRRARAVRLDHAVAALRHLSRAVGLLAAGAHARLRHRTRSACCTTLILAGRMSDDVGRRPVLLVALGTLMVTTRAVHGRRTRSSGCSSARGAAGPRHRAGARRRERGDARPASAPRPRRRRARQRRAQRRRPRAWGCWPRRRSSRCCPRRACCPTCCCSCSSRSPSPARC